MAPFLRLAEVSGDEEYQGVTLDTHKQVFALALVSANLLVGCGQQPEFEANQSTLQNRTLPFHSDAANQRASNPSLSWADVASGTSIQVHLQTPLSSSRGRTGDSFRAALDAPIVLSGLTIAPKGALLTGKILEAKSSNPFREAGYLRLALTEISIDGKSMPLLTSSIFLKGATYEREVSAPPVQLVGTKTLLSKVAPAPQRIEVREDAAVSSERLLTFRLTQPAVVEHGGQ